MKKSLLLTIVSSFLFIAAHSQITKGSVLLGGDVIVLSDKSEFAQQGNQNNVILAPSIGLAIKQNMIIGIDLAYQRNKSTAQYNFSDLKSYGAGFFIRKYKPLGNRFLLFGESSLDYSNSDLTLGNPVTDTQKAWSINLNVYPGLAYSVTKKFQVEASFPNLLEIGYSNMKSYQPLTPASTSKNFGFVANANNLFYPAIGARFLL